MLCLAWKLAYKANWATSNTKKCKCQKQRSRRSVRNNFETHNLKLFLWLESPPSKSLECWHPLAWVWSPASQKHGGWETQNHRDRPRECDRKGKEKIAKIDLKRERDRLAEVPCWTRKNSRVWDNIIISGKGDRKRKWSKERKREQARWKRRDSDRDRARKRWKKNGERKGDRVRERTGFERE